MRRGKRTRRSAGEWRELFGELERSGKTQKAFCSARGISLGGFQNALRREREGARFVDVTRAVGWEGEVVFPNGVTVRVRG